MFKKIEIWVLYLFMILGVIILIGYGALVRHELLNQRDSFGQDTQFPALTKIAMFLAEIPSTVKNISENDLVRADRFPEVTGFVGDPLDDDAYLLLSRYDGDLGQSIVDLVDLKTFEVLHTWNPDITAINKLVDTSNVEFETFLRDRAERRYLIHNPLLFDDGSIAFHSMSSPLLKIDYCGDLVWQNQEQRFHHSIERDHQGNLWVPTHNYPYSIDEKLVGSHVDNYLDDAIAKISPDGEILFEKSVSQILIENNLEYLLFSIGGEYEKDPLHLNDIQPVLQDGPFWKQGDLFLSLRNQSMIVLYRPGTNEIIWQSAGHTSQQHDVSILDDRRISIFDNNAQNTIKGHVVDGYNEVAVYDFEKRSFSKYLNASLKEQEVRSTTAGISVILDTGELYFEEQNFSRTLFFNSDGSLRWQHVNRAEDGRVYRVSWSRLLHEDSDIMMVKNILTSRTCENEET